MNEIPLNASTGRSLLIRIAVIPVLALINFAINMFGIAMTARQTSRQLPSGELLRIFGTGAIASVAWVVVSFPVQLATRRLVRERLAVAVAAHIVLVAGFMAMYSVLSVGIRSAAGLMRPGLPLVDHMTRHFVAMVPFNLLVYTALVAATLAWDNWRLSVRRERTAAHLTAELTRAELAALRSKIQPHFLFNALHGISSVMDTDAAKARQMMVALSHLLRSSLSAGGESLVPLKQELQLTRDYLDLQNMRFEERLQYDLRVDAQTDVRVPSFILQPLVENAVIHGMADRSEPTRVRVTVRRVGDEIEIDVSDNGPGFPEGILDGTAPMGVGLGALRARLLALPGGRATMTLGNSPGGGAQVTLRVPTDDDEGSNA